MFAAFLMPKKKAESGAQIAQHGQGFLSIHARATELADDSLGPTDRGNYLGVSWCSPEIVLGGSDGCKEGNRRKNTTFN